MKARLNITIEQQLLDKVKVYALRKHVSISALVEDYLEAIVHGPSKRKNLLEMIDKLHPNPKVVAESHHKEAFYEKQKEEYGF
jgi:hypothetical protein